MANTNLKQIEVGRDKKELKEHGSEDFPFLVSYERLGDLRRRQRDYASAEELYRKALDIREGLVGDIARLHSAILHVGHVSPAPRVRKPGECGLSPLCGAGADEFCVSGSSFFGK